MGKLRSLAEPSNEATTRKGASPYLGRLETLGRAAIICLAVNAPRVIPEVATPLEVFAQGHFLKSVSPSNNRDLQHSAASENLQSIN